MLKNLQKLREYQKSRRKDENIMEINLIYGGNATLEDLYALNELGFEFIVEDGEVTNVLH